MRCIRTRLIHIPQRSTQMSARIWLPLAALGVFATFAVVGPNPSLALTAKECSAKYKAAKRQAR